MTGHVLVYGATGYTGRQVAQALAEAGTPVVLAGRDPEAVAQVAQLLNLAWTAFPLEDTGRLDAALSGAQVVLHAAGPYVETAAPMLAACLRTGTHYLDLAGEWPVFADAKARDADAEAAGVMLMPGVGLTIVATDCLLALAKQAQPDAVKLRLGVSRAQVMSRGTVVSAAGLLGPGVLVRRAGQLVQVPAGSLSCAFDFGEGLREATAMSWADVVTGEHSTGVGDIEIYSELPWYQRTAYRASGLAMAVGGAAPWRAAGRGLAAACPEGPGGDARRAASFVMAVEALDPWRRPRRLRLRTLDGYTVSVLTAAAAAQKVLAGQWSAGFQTPSRVFGADFILNLGCARLEGAPTSEAAA
jgi:short subunit dehydrogenase-like uncharacterized protein